jgi:hypothetical protein
MNATDSVTGISANNVAIYVWSGVGRLGHGNSRRNQRRIKRRQHASVWAADSRADDTNW